jgi:hypothetical protein
MKERVVVNGRKLSLRTYRQGDHFVGVITDEGTGEVLATEKTTRGNGEGNTLTHLSRKLRGTGLVPANLKIVKKSTVSYVMERRP